MFHNHIPKCPEMKTQVWFHDPVLKLGSGPRFCDHWTIQITSLGNLGLTGSADRPIHKKGTIQRKEVKESNKYLAKKKKRELQIGKRIHDDLTMHS